MCPIRNVAETAWWIAGIGRLVRDHDATTR
jgi:hypothetical protein